MTTTTPMEPLTLLEHARTALGHLDTLLDEEQDTVDRVLAARFAPREAA